MSEFNNLFLMIFFCIIFFSNEFFRFTPQYFKFLYETITLAIKMVDNLNDDAVKKYIFIFIIFNVFSRHNF